MSTIQNELHWEQHKRPVTQGELKNALKVVGDNPDFNKTFWASDPSLVLVPLKRYVLTMSQEDLANDKVASDVRNKLVSMNHAYAHGLITDETIDMKYGAHDVLAAERHMNENEKEEQILRDGYAAYGIDVKSSNDPYRNDWEEPISIPDVPAFGADGERRQQTRKQVNILQTGEGVGDNRNPASRKDINIFPILHIHGGWRIDWDVESHPQPGMRNSFPLDYETPIGFAMFYRPTVGDDNLRIEDDTVAGVELNNDIVAGVARNPLYIGIMERMVQAYQRNAQEESQESLEGLGKKEKNAQYYGSLLGGKKRVPRYSSLKERNTQVRAFGHEADPKWNYTLNSTGTRLINKLLKEIAEELAVEGKTFPCLFEVPPSIRVPLTRYDEAKWSLKPQKSFAATLDGGSHVSLDEDIGVIEYATPIRSIITVQKSEVSEYPNIMQEWFPKGQVARFWRDPDNPDEALGFILSGKKVQGEVAIKRHRGNLQEENVFKFLAQQDAYFFDEMTAYKPTESNGDIYLTAYKGKQPLGEPQRVDAVSSRAIYNTVAEHVWQEEFKKLDLSGNGFLENIVSERLENSSEIGDALSSRYALTFFDQLKACRKLSKREKPSAESMDHAVASLQENQDQMIQRHPGLYAEVVMNFLNNSNISDKHRHLLTACMKESRANKSEEEKKKYEEGLVDAAKDSEESRWAGIDERASVLGLDRQADVCAAYLENKNVTDDKFAEILRESKGRFRYSERNLIKVAQAAASSYRTSEQAEILREVAQSFPASDKKPIIESVDAREHELLSMGLLNPLKRKRSLDDDKSRGETSALPDRSRRRFDGAGRPAPLVPFSGRTTPPEQQVTGGEERTGWKQRNTATKALEAMRKTSPPKGKGKERGDRA